MIQQGAPTPSPYDSLDSTECHKLDAEVGSENNPKTSNKFRFLLITLGPTGSGKSVMAKNLKEKTKEINAVAYSMPWFDKVIDDYVEESESYRTRMTELIDANPIDMAQYPLDGCSISSQPWKGMASKMVDIYFDVRINEKIPLAYNNQFEKNVENGLNIVMEITGKSEWTIIENLNRVLLKTNSCTKYHYIVLAGFSLVDYYLLQERNISRFKSALKKFNENRAENHPPRLPWVGCFSHKNVSTGDSKYLSSYCDMLKGINKTIMLLLDCGYYYDGGKFERTKGDAMCYFDKSTSIKQIPATGQNPNPMWNTHGFPIDYLYIYNNIYTKATLMAKINLSQRSIFLETNSDYSSHFDKSELPVLIEIIDKMGPPKTSEGVYDACGDGTPSASPANNAHPEPRKSYRQRNIFPEGRRNTRRSRKNNVNKSRKSRRRSYM